MKALRNIPAAQVALVLMLNSASCAIAQNWTQTTAPTNEYWRAVASSADGTRIVAAGLGAIHLSTNSGSTWTLTSAPGEQTWSSVASSADGTKLAAVADSLPIYISADGGANWKPSDSPSNSWQGVACSGDGTRMVAVYGVEFSTGGIYTSTNSGTTWTASDSPTNGYGWYAVASSADGIKLAAMQVDALTPSGPYGWIYTSTNGAEGTWAQTTRIGGPCSLASSADGTKLIAAQGQFGPLGGLIQTSTNSGANWATASVPYGAWSSVASSADGTHLAATIGGSFDGPITGPVYTSTDSGETWTTDSPTNDWVSVTSSADGCTLVAAVNGGGIYIRRTTPAPRLDISLSGTGVLLSWRVPSMRFVLQQNSDLSTANWTGVTVTPALNHTNLEYQATIPMPPGTTAYRLVSQ